MKTLGVGTVAPNFSLTNYDGKIVTLSDTLKKSAVVLIFYIADESPNCDRLLCRINVEVDEFAAAGFQVMGINNAGPAWHGRYAKRRLMKMPLLSDPECRVSESYDSVYAIGPIKVIRYSVVGIGQDGIIRYYKRGRPANAEIIAGMNAGLGRAVAA